MRCTVCDQENREGQNFCAVCGAPLAVACPTCGTTRDRGDKFCGACGAPMGSPSQNHRQPAPLHPGVNAGEPIAENGDLFGAAVIIAARLGDEADGGQIVVADVVRQLVAGKDFVFGDRGETALKGIQAPMRTWELLW